MFCGVNLTVTPSINNIFDFESRTTSVYKRYSSSYVIYVVVEQINLQNNTKVIHVGSMNTCTMSVPPTMF